MQMYLVNDNEIIEISIRELEESPEIYNPETHTLMSDRSKEACRKSYTKLKEFMSKYSSKEIIEILTRIPFEK